MLRHIVCQGSCTALLVFASLTVSAQGPKLNKEQMDQLVARIALYPDPLLAQVLAASTHWEQIPEAAAWAQQHSNLRGDALAAAIEADNLQWDPTVIALLPFPSVLQMMAQDLAWTEQLGTAVLEQKPEVMEAIQRMRKKAEDYGYLQSNAYVNVVTEGNYIQILPAEPNLIYVPVYDPVVVFARPAGRIAVGAAITWGPAITISAAFAPWGWLNPVIFWPRHEVIFDRGVWGPVWGTRRTYVHPYFHPWVHAAGPRVERHRIVRK